ncbi:MAG TPA: transposase [Candidatus Coprenecus pullistercoris]|nr:transposase [Candidatus Coprenecus pullistercoris]
MNSIPVCAVGNQVTILAFCLMSNHVHFIAHGEEDNCRKFITQYKKRLTALTNLSSTDICIKHINDDDYLMKAIGYVLRNPVSAGIRLMPYHYDWSSASLYFKKPDSGRLGKKIGTLSYRSKRELLHSQTTLLDEYILTEKGLILPECYVDFEYVENLFRSPARLMYAMSRNENMEMELSVDILHKTKYSDEELSGTIKELCEETFQKSSADLLSIEDRYRLAKILHNRYRLSRKQLARLTMTEPSLLKNML